MAPLYIQIETVDKLTPTKLNPIKNMCFYMTRYQHNI